MVVQMCCINSQWFSTYQFEWVDQTSWWGTSVSGCRQSRSEWRTRHAPASTCHHLNELWLGPAVYCPREITLWYHLNWPKEKKPHRYFLIKTIYNIHIKLRNTKGNQLKKHVLLSSHLFNFIYYETLIFVHNV